MKFVGPPLELYYPRTLKGGPELMWDDVCLLLQQHPHVVAFASSSRCGPKPQLLAMTLLADKFKVSPVICRRQPRHPLAPLHITLRRPRIDL